MTLMDIWLSLRRHRRLVAVIVAVAALAGIALALLLPRQYSFTTAIEIGSEHRFVTTIEGVNQVVSDQIQPIETPTTVISKLEKGYIPEVTAQFVAAHPEGPRHYSFAVDGNKDTQIVTLASEGPRELAANHMELHRLILAALVQDHNRTADAMRDNAKIQLADAEQRLGALVAEQKSLTEQVASFDHTIADLSHQAEELKARIAQAEAESARNGSDSAHATQALLLSQEVGGWRVALAELEQKADLDLRIGRAKAQAALDNTAREQEAAQSAIQFRQTNLANVEATRALGPTIMSAEPVAPNKPVVIGMAIVVGLFIAVAAALARDFLAEATQFERDSASAASDPSLTLPFQGRE
jgi:capsular polysaccharide biosynthesis protein